MKTVAANEAAVEQGLFGEVHYVASADVWVGSVQGLPLRHAPVFEGSEAEVRGEVARELASRGFAGARIENHTSLTCGRCGKAPHLFTDEACVKAVRS